MNAIVKLALMQQNEYAYYLCGVSVHYNNKILFKFCSICSTQVVK